MKEKIITIKVNGANQGQWSNLLLELNLMSKAWKSYGVDMSLKAPGLKSTILWGQESVNTTDHLDDLAKEYNQTKDPRTKELWLEKVKEWANASNNIRRRNVSTYRGNETDDGTYRVIW